MFEALWGTVAGLLVGSFLNVCVYRWPRDESVVRPRSRCPGCGSGIAWFDNIPVLSFLLLRARCRRCGAAISFRYPAVELLTAGCFAWLVYRMGFTAEAAKWSVFVAILIGLGVADAETRILPDEMTLGGIVLGLLLALTSADRLWSLADSALGAVVPSGALWLAGYLFEKVRHKEGLGFGDVKMTAMIGAFTGLRGALLILAIGSTLGSVVGLAYIALARKDAATYELPLGTFLAAGGLLFALFNLPG